MDRQVAPTEAGQQDFQPRPQVLEAPHAAAEHAPAPSDRCSLVGKDKLDRVGQLATFAPARPPPSASSVPCCSSSTTSGSSTTATCRPRPWPNSPRRWSRCFHPRLPPQPHEPRSPQPTPKLHQLDVRDRFKLTLSHVAFSAGAYRFSHLRTFCNRGGAQQLSLLRTPRGELRSVTVTRAPRQLDGVMMSCLSLMPGTGDICRRSVRRMVSHASLSQSTASVDHTVTSFNDALGPPVRLRRIIRSDSAIAAVGRWRHSGARVDLSELRTAQIVFNLCGEQKLEWRQDVGTTRSVASCGSASVVRQDATAQLSISGSADTIQIVLDPSLLPSALNGPCPSTNRREQSLQALSAQAHQGIRCNWSPAAACRSMMRHVPNAPLMLVVATMSLPSSARLTPVSCLLRPSHPGPRRRTRVASVPSWRTR